MSMYPSYSWSADNVSFIVRNDVDQLPDVIPGLPEAIGIELCVYVGAHGLGWDRTQPHVRLVGLLVKHGDADTVHLP